MATYNPKMEQLLGKIEGDWWQSEWWLADGDEMAAAITLEQAKSLPFRPSRSVTDKRKVGPIENIYWSLTRWLDDTYERRVMRRLDAATGDMKLEDVIDLDFTLIDRYLSRWAYTLSDHSRKVSDRKWNRIHKRDSYLWGW